MNRLLAALCSSVLGALLSLQGIAIGQSTDVQVANIIVGVKSLPASKLDQRLPELRLADWLQAVGGPQAKINWAYVTAVDRADTYNYPDRVEATVTLNHDQMFFVSIDVSSNVHPPSFESGWLIMSEHEDVELDRLGDLPAAINKLRETNQKLVRSEAHR